MAWSTPLTAVANTMLTAGQWNASVRDNLKESEAAVASRSSRILVTDGANRLAERDILDHIIDDQETTTATSYGDLTPVGPVVTITTGTLALTWLNGQVQNTASTNTFMSVALSGATTVAASDAWALECDGGAGQANRLCVHRLQSCNPGVNVFTTKYRVSGGTGTFYKRRLIVMGL